MVSIRNSRLTRLSAGVSLHKRLRRRLWRGSTMNHWFSNLSKGFFGPRRDEEREEVVLAATMMEVESRKRSRDDDGSQTPTLRGEDEVFTPPVKRFREEIPFVEVKVETKIQTVPTRSPLAGIPEDTVAHCLAFLGSSSDRFAIQNTCKQFKRISDSPCMLKQVEVGGDKSTGLHGIILESDTVSSASQKLLPFVKAGNLEATYMLGIIKSYSGKEATVMQGIKLLKHSASKGYLRSSYALGLILRDSKPHEAVKYMKAAAKAKYLPALQELLSARDMKTNYGEPAAEELRRHLDPLCLNRLLCRGYCESSSLRDYSTSHCWNPLCGRWAFKASSTARPQLMENVKDHNCDDFRVSRMKMCSRCCRAKYCSKLCQVYDWRSGRHKMECQFL